MLYFCPIERRDFGDLMSTGGILRLPLRRLELFDEILLYPVHSYSVLALWSQNPHETGQLPELLICADGLEEDWAAWITTYVARIRPFSAYMRLASYAEMQRVQRTFREPRLNRLAWPMAGIVLGEVLAVSNLPDKALDNLSASAYASTLSFSMLRAAAMYSDFQQWVDLVASWEEVRHITRQRIRSIGASSVANVCLTILRAAGLTEIGPLALNDSSVLEACHELITQPGVVPSGFAEVPGFPAIEARMNGSREDSIVALMNFVNNSLALKNGSQEMTSLLLGYLASRVAPGTIRHSSVLMPIAQYFPSAMLWYGFCAGLGGIEGGRTSAGSPRSGLDLPLSARRVVRDLLRPEPMVGPPQCDVSFLELAVLARTGGDPLEGFITTHQGTATVELALGVCTTVNSPYRASLSEGKDLALRNREIRTTIGECIERLRGAYAKLGDSNAEGDEGKQSTKSSPRRRKK